MDKDKSIIKKDEDKSTVKKDIKITKQDIDKHKLNLAIKTYKKKGFYAPSFYDINNVKQLKWLYYFFTNGFNGVAAYKSAGYTGKNPVQCVFALKKKLAPQIAELLKDESIENDLEVELIKMSNVDLADFEDFTSGKKTLKELRDEGIDTSAIKSVKKGFDRDGQPYAMIDIESSARIKEKLLKLKRQADDEVARQINVAEQTINIITNVPSYHDREKYSKKVKVIDVDAKEITENRKDKK